MVLNQVFVYLSRESLLWAKSINVDTLILEKSGILPLINRRWVAPVGIAPFFSTHARELSSSLSLLKDNKSNLDNLLDSFPLLS